MRKDIPKKAAGVRELYDLPEAHCRKSQKPKGDVDDFIFSEQERKISQR